MSNEPTQRGPKQTANQKPAPAAPVIRQLRPTVIARKARSTPTEPDASAAAAVSPALSQAAAAPAPTATASATANPAARKPDAPTSTPARVAAPARPTKSGVEIWQGRPGVPMAQWAAQQRRRVQGAPLQGRAPFAGRTGGPARRGPAWSSANNGRSERRPNAARASLRPSPPTTAERAAHKRVIKALGAISVAALAAAVGVKASDVLMELMRLGAQGVHLNSSLDLETAELVASRFGWSVENTALSDVELLNRARPETSTSAAVLAPRPPVVTVMGHVDHGKTTLLDWIRHSNVAENEAGGITQRLGAHVTETPRGPITFIDTPGHAAFSALRARGARLTDIVILVVAADDGLMPQSREAIELARTAKVPIVVAINKMDRPGADAARVRQELGTIGLVPEEWGGETLVAEISALTGQGVPELLEQVLLQAEVLELRAAPERAASGVVLEAELDTGKGPLVTVLIQDGTLNLRDTVVAGNTWGKVRALVDERGRAREHAGPGTPVALHGLKDLPRAGDVLHVVKDAQAAQHIADQRQREERQRLLGSQSAKALQIDFASVAKERKPTLALVLKADVDGSLDALRNLLRGLATPEIELDIVHAAVGAISESDIQLAAAASASVFGFNVNTVGRARALARQHGVDISLHEVIYDLADEAQRAMARVLGPKWVERQIGSAEIRQVFRAGTTRAAGCKVVEGVVRRGAQVRVLRGEAEVGRGSVESLRRIREDAREVREGLECGVVVNGFEAFEVGDRLVVSELEEERLALRAS